MEIDWKEKMLQFMAVVGHSNNDWYPECWNEFGISNDEAKIIIDAYAEKHKGEGELPHE